VPSTDVRAGATAEPALEVRLHSPRPDILIVRPSGALTGITAAQLGERIVHRGRWACHVVVDVGDLAPVTPAAVPALAEQARRCGVQVHLAAERGFPAPLRAGEGTWHCHPGRSVETVLALLPRSPGRPA
jgi:hypothetical protein